MGEIRLIKIQHPFNRQKRTEEMVDYNHENLQVIRDTYFPKELGVIVSVNGGVVPKENLSLVTLKHGDEVVFYPEIEGGGGDILRTVAMLALVAVAIWAGQVWMAPMVAPGAFSGGVATIAGGSAFVGGMISAGIMIAGGYLINALLPAPTPDTDAYSNNLDSVNNSNTFSWQPVTRQQQGLVLPKFYGLIPVYGNIISTYTENVSDKNYINVLLHVGQGPINRLYDYYINDQPVENLTGVNVVTKYGLINQSVIPNFDDTKTEYTTNVNCTYNTPYTYETTGSAFDGIEVDITFPRGLYYANDRGGLDATSVDIQVLIKKQGDTYWIPLTKQTNSVAYTVDNSYWEYGYYVIEYGYEGQSVNTVWYPLGTGSSDPTAHTEGELKERYVDGDNYGCYIYWHWVSSTGTAYANTVVNYVTVLGCQNSALIKTFKSETNLSHGKYDVKVTRLSADYGTRYGSDSYLTAVREVFKDDFTYPRSALVGIKALATDQLSGSFKFKCMMEASLIRYYDGSNWQIGYNNNPAWVCYDVFTQPLFDDPDEVAGSDGLNYRCIADHTSSADNKPITGGDYALYWQQGGENGTVGDNIITRGTASADSVHSTGYEADKACDNNLTTDWVSKNTAFPHWWKYDFGITKIVSKLRIYKYYDTSGQTLKDFTLQGSNDDAAWDIIYTGTAADATANEWEEWNFANVTGYRYYKVNVTSNYRTDTYVAFYEVQMFETGLKTMWELSTDYKTWSATALRYDGIDPTRLDTTTFKEWADWCDTLVLSGKEATDLESGTVTSATTTTLADSTQAWKYNVWVGKVVETTGGTGSGQRRYIKNNTDTSLIVDPAWTTPLDGTTTYAIREDYERNFTFDGGFDSGTTLWEAALQIALMSRALLVWDGTTIKVIIDKAVTLPDDVSQLFSTSNIYVNSFEETFLSSSERTGEIEINFVNKDLDYEKDSCTVFNTTLDKPENRNTISLLGTTNPSQAWRMGYFFLSQNELLKRTIKFDADVDAITCMVGDVIYFQHDVPQWGVCGGRVVSSTANTVTLDQEVTLEASPTTYSIMVWLSDDTLLVKTVDNSSPGATSTLAITDTWDSDNPSQDDKFAFGESDNTAKAFRVIEVARTSDLKCTIRAVEYDADVYSVDSGTPTLPTFSHSLNTAIAVVTNVTLSEIAYVNESGASNRNILVRFNKPVNVYYSHAEIWYKDTTSAYTFAGRADTTEFYISNVNPNTAYTVRIVSVSNSMVKTNITNSPTATITTSRELSTVVTVLQSRITGLEIFNQRNDNTFTGRDCKFCWNPLTAVNETSTGAGNESAGAGTYIPPVWLKDYEVKIYDSTGATLRRTEYVSSPEYVYTFEKNYDDGGGTPVREFQIQVKARDTFYRVSATPAKITVTNAAPTALTDITVASGTGYYIVEFSPSTAPDLLGYKVYASQTTGFTPATANLVNEGADTRIVISPSKSGTWYIKVAAYDAFGTIDLNYSAQYSVTVTKWLEYDDLELELMKMTFQSISWAQFAIFDDFSDETKRSSPDPFPYEAALYKNSIVTGSEVSTVYGWTSQTYTNMTTIDSGTATSVGVNFLADTSKSWFTNEMKNLTLIDSASTEFTVISNTTDTLTVSGTPASGAYSLKDDNPAYMVCHCTYEDSTEGGGYGYVKLEVSFDDGANYQTVLDTENSIDLLEGTIAINTPGVDYKFKLSLTTNSDGNGPIVRKVLIATDPSPWRY